MNARVCLAAAVVMALSTVSAQAFTYDNRTNQNPDGSARFTDPESALGTGKGDGNSHFSMHFSGGASGNQNNNDSRFVPSANGVFASPYNNTNNMDLALGNRHW